MSTQGALGVLLAVALFVWAAAPAIAQTGNDTPQNAIKRIQSGQHTPLPPLTSAPASRETGRGLDIENRSGGTLLVYFSGAVDRTVTVQDGQSIGVDLTVGEYEIGAEVLSSRTTPFYGRQVFAPNTHYWMKFFTAAQPASSSLVATIDPEFLKNARVTRDRAAK